MSQYVNGNVKTFTAGGAIAVDLLVKISSGKLAVAGLLDEILGTMEAASFADGDVASVRLKSAAGTHSCVSENAIAEGAAVYGRAGGKVDDVSTGATRLGIALEAATAANDVIEVLFD